MRANLSVTGLKIEPKERKLRSGATYSFTKVTPEPGVNASEVLAAMFPDATALLGFVCSGITKQNRAEALAAAQGKPSVQDRKKAKMAKKLSKLVETLSAQGFSLDEIKAALS